MMLRVDPCSSNPVVLPSAEKSRRSLANRSGWVSVAVLVLAVGIGLFVAAQGPIPADDAYITFRHVRNLLQEGRPAWNLHGDPVLGSTSPAYMFTLAGVAFLARTSDVPTVARCVNGALGAVMVVLVYLVACDLTGRRSTGLLAAALVGFNSVNAFIFAQGFEAPMLVAAMLGSVFCASRSRYGWAMGLASIAPLIRPEGILVSPLVWGVALARREARWRLLLFYLPVPLLWLMFSSIYYGSPIPQPLRAIAHFPMTHEPFRDEPANLLARLPGTPAGAVDLWKRSAGQLLASGTVERESALPLESLRYGVIVLGAIMAMVFASRRGAGGKIIYVLVGPMWLLLFGCLGHTKPWYFPPFVTFGLLVAVAGWSFVTDRLLGLAPLAEQAKRGWAAVVLVFIIGLLLSGNQYRINRGQVDYRGRALVFPQHPWGRLWDLWEAQRYAEYRGAAAILNEKGASRKTALISEVGVFGYFFEGDVLDSVGLCSPEALAFYPPPASDVRDPSGKSFAKAGTLVPTAMVRGLEPDFVVNSRVYIANLLQPDSPFLERYHEAARLGLVWGEPLMIYERNADPPVDDLSIDD